MKEKIEEKTKKLQQIIATINHHKNQISQLESEGLMIQGEIRLLRQMELDSSVEAEKQVKETKKKK